MNTVKCPLCRVDVPIDKIDLQNRCLHPQCPLKRPRARSLQSLSTPWRSFRPGRAHQGAFLGPPVVGTETNKGGMLLSLRCWTSTHTHAPLLAVADLNQFGVSSRRYQSGCCGGSICKQSHSDSVVRAKEEHSRTLTVLSFVGSVRPLPLSLSMSTRRPGPIFVIRLRAGPKVDAIRALRAALKVLGRRFGLRAISIRAELESDLATPRRQN